MEDDINFEHTSSRPQSSNTWLIAALIGSLLVIIAYFLGFISVSLLGFKESESGIEMLSDGDLTFWKYLPLITVILAIVAIIVAAVRKDTGAKKPLICLGLLMIIITVIFIYSVTSGMIVDGIDDYGVLKNLVDIDIGVYITLIGNIVTLIAAFLPGNN